MHDRLFSGNPECKAVRDVSNILYNEVKKHDANRHLIYIFDDDFIAAAQEWDSLSNQTMLVPDMTHNLWLMIPLKVEIPLETSKRKESI